METKFLQRNIFQRILGIPATPKHQDSTCWNYSDGKLTVDLDKVPELGKPGGVLRLEGGNLPQRVLIIFGADDKYHAYRNRCTHLAHRRLDPVPGTHTVQCCSVNKSTYDLDGNKVHGPAPHPIEVYPADIDNNKLVVTIKK